MSTILITGASGFIGSNLVKFFSKEGWTVIAASRNPPSEVFELNNSVHHVNLKNIKFFLQRHFLSLDLCVHAAAVLPSSGQSEEDLINDNINEMQKILSIFDEMYLGSFVFLSSMAAYGKLIPPIVDETTPSHSPSAYGRSKLACENLLAFASSKRAFSAFSIRLCGVVGVGSHHNFLSDLVLKIRNRLQVEAFNPEQLFNSAIHVDDVCSLTLSLSQHRIGRHEMMPVGAKEFLKIRDVVSFCYDAFRYEENVNYKKVAPAPMIATTKAESFGFVPPSVISVLQKYLAASKTRI